MTSTSSRLSNISRVLIDSYRDHAVPRSSRLLGNSVGNTAGCQRDLEEIREQTTPCSGTTATSCSRLFRARRDCSRASTGRKEFEERGSEWIIITLVGTTTQKSDLFLRSRFLAIRSTEILGRAVLLSRALAAVGECKRSPDRLLRTIVRIGLGSNSGHYGTRRSLESGSRRRSA